MHDDHACMHALVLNNEWDENSQSLHACDIRLMKFLLHMESALQRPGVPSEHHLAWRQSDHMVRKQVLYLHYLVTFDFML